LCTNETWDLIIYVLKQVMINGSRIQNELGKTVYRDRHWSTVLEENQLADQKEMVRTISVPGASLIADDNDK
jgi:hypothetical protein